LHRPNTPHTIYTDELFANSAIITFDSNSTHLKHVAEKILVLDEYEKTLLNKIISEAKLTYADRLNDVNLTKMTKKSVSPFGTEQIIKNSIELLLVSVIRNFQIKKTPVADITLNVDNGLIVKK
jgi:hypothetical protein